MEQAQVLPGQMQPGSLDRILVGHRHDLLPGVAIGQGIDRSTDPKSELRNRFGSEVQGDGILQVGA